VGCKFSCVLAELWNYFPIFPLTLEINIEFVGVLCGKLVFAQSGFLIIFANNTSQCIYLYAGVSEMGEDKSNNANIRDQKCEFEKKIELTLYKIK